jgi:hypothetical protein
MNSGTHKSVALFSLIAMGLVVAAGALAQSARRGPPIKFSEPSSEAGATNLNLLADPRKNNLKRLEEDLGRSLRLFQPDAGAGSTRMLPRPPAGPVIQSPKVRELLDKQKNWAFAQPGDAPTALDSKDMLSTSELEGDESQNTDQAIIERYYERQVEGDSAVTNRTSDSLLGSEELEDDLTLRPEFDDPAKTAVKEELDRAEAGSRQLFRQEDDFRVMPDSGSSQMMPKVFDSKPPNSWQSRAQEERLEQFKQSLQTDALKSTPSGLPSLPSYGGGLGAGTLQNSWGNSPTVVAPSVSPAVPSGMDSIKSAVLPSSPAFSGASPAAYAPPPPVRPPPPSPFSNIPKRNF